MSPQPMLVMLDFLNEIRATGKITRAADQRGHVLSARLEPDREMVGVLRRAAGRARAGTRHHAHALRRASWCGPGSDCRRASGRSCRICAQELETEINQLLPHAPVDHPHPRQPRLCGLEAARNAQPRAGYRRRPALRRATRTRSASLAHGGCDLAGMHLPQGELRKRSIAASKSLADRRASIGSSAS